MKEATRKQVFISYAHENLETVQRVVGGLKKRKLDIWFAKKDLGPGRWKPQIIKAINRSRYFIICISEAALRKTGEEPGFQDNEVNTAYGIAQEQPDKEFTIVPVRLEDCGRGDFRISSFQQYDLFDDFQGGLDKLAVHLGGVSLADAEAQDERTEYQKMIQGIFSRGVAAYYATDFEKAINFWDSVLALDPIHPSSWSNKGVALGKLGRHKEALVAFDSALKHKPDDAKAWSNRGVALEKLGRHEEALVAFDSALNLKLDDAKTCSNRGVVLEKLGRHEEALVAFDRALKLEERDSP